MTFLQLVTIVVHDYDPAIQFFVDIMEFELVEDSLALTTDGRPKRWVVVRPPGAQTACCWPVRMVSASREWLESSTRAVWDSFCAWTTSLLVTNE